ncbi:hypothetical protein BDL97_04G074100, partial [Sphagnum fallax]
HPWLPSHLIFLLYDRNPDLPTMIHRESSEVVNLDDPKMWLRVRSQRVELFRRVMLVAFENLAIAQHKDTLRFHVGDYVYLQQTTSTTLDVTEGRTILRVREVLASGVLMLEGCDVDPSLVVVHARLRCMLCGSRGGATHMLVCDRCSRGWHMACMTPPMDVVPTGRWVCPCTLEG